MILTDKYNRAHNYLRISVTDSCNLQCIYCNPIDSCNNNFNKNEILSFDEIVRIIRIFLNSGFTKFRFTGGEPLARKGIVELFEKVNLLKKEFSFELSITSNATLLEDKIVKFKENGLDRINISLDSLNRETFNQITGSDMLPIVLSNIQNAKDAGYKNIKINTVIIRGINDNELTDFCEFSIKNELNVRFIEFMPFSNNGWQSDSFIDSDEMKQIISKKYKLVKVTNGNYIAEDYIINGKGKISFISPLSNHFCAMCNRLRVTSDGKLKLCLFSSNNELLDLKAMLRNEDFTQEKIISAVSNYLEGKASEHKPILELTKLNSNNMLRIGG